MSTFSSVVRKPGQKIAPKAAPRRNVQRNPPRPTAAPSLTPESQAVTEKEAVPGDQSVAEKQPSTENLPVAEIQTVTPSIEDVHKGLPAQEGAQTGEKVSAQAQQRTDQETNRAQQANDQEVNRAPPVLESTEIPPVSAAVETSVPLAASPEPVARSSPQIGSQATPPDSVQVLPPSIVSQDATIIHPVHTSPSPRRVDAIPTVAPSGTPTPQKRRLTNELTPVRSEESTQDVDGGAEEHAHAPEPSPKRQKTSHPQQHTSPRCDGGIPMIAPSGAPTVHRRRLTNEPTPVRSEDSTQAGDGGAEEQAHSPEPSPKRQKTSHPQQHTAPTRTSVTPPPTDSLQNILRSSPRHRRSESRTSDVLLKDATSQAAAVSELANSIENRVRETRSRAARPAAASMVETDSPDEQVSEPDVNEARKAKKPRKKRARNAALEGLADQVVENAVTGGKRGGSRRLSRLPTPENAEEHEVDPDEVSMGDLVRDNKLGKKSETEKRMQENWEDILRRRKEEIERRREAAGQRRHGRQELNLNQAAEESGRAHVPQQIIVNGQIVVAAESREVAFGAGVEQAVIEDADVALEDDRIYKYVHQGTLGKHAGRRRGTRWDDVSTELFYKGLRMFGTDFSLIANLFPGMDRRQIKLKFVAEQRINPARVERSVATKEPVDIEEYARMTNQEFQDPDALQAELDAEEKRLRDEEERRRANQGYVDGADVALPSTEGDGDGVGEDGREAHLASLAQGVVNAAGRKQGQVRRGKEPLGRGRQAKKKGMPMEGVEERIGPIEEVYGT
ncbi:hypothetical protein HRR86_001894 [Exophiala dermatitidis]|nr:hypothetical protein HRR73_006176 [Exophiala dermatitidis]KAJ4602571.1 hypothetical protein HRR84_002329 [Exophiala dermatitidis]KAJ4632751.1 hypothetical protein HRR86_001894 [Exophiala dermatitidis]